MIPALSRLQDDKERYAAAHLKAMRVLALISFPLAGGLAVMAEEAILVVFGPTWIEAVPIFRVLCIAGLFQAWGNSVGWLYVSAGKTRNMFLWATVACPVIALAFLPCIWYGAVGAAVGYAAIMILIVPAGMWYAARSVGVPLLPLVRAAAGPLAATGVMCACVLLLRAHVFAEMSLALRSVALVGSGVVCFGPAAAVLARRALSETISILRCIVSGSPVEAAACRAAGS
jgi:PST family polysaccharide transporter